MKATAIAPANIAFIKYWGKSDLKLRLPINNSISMNLSDLYSICTVEFKEDLIRDEIEFDNELSVKKRELQRIVEVLDRVRIKAGSNLYARVKTKNNFPKATGIASSASGFASLSLAALSALGVRLSEKELSIFARMASGSACRSIPDGFVEWQKGIDSDSSYAWQIFPSDYWDICDVVAIISTVRKEFSSTEGQALAQTSPFYKQRLEEMDEKVSQLKKLIRERNFSAFGRLIEDEALNMHAICFTSRPPLIYWEPTTLEIMKSIMKWRKSGEVESYFTIDAGPSVHVICQNKDAAEIKQRLSTIEAVEKVVVNHPSFGARLINEHLF